MSRTRFAFLLATIACLLALGAFAAPRLATGSLVPQLFAGHAFSYQGYFEDNGIPANGSYDFLFQLVENEVVVDSSLQPNLLVANGLVNATLRFDTPFDGAAYQLEVQVRPGDSTGPYQPLTPTQPLGSAPYANRAHSSAASDTPMSTETIIGWDPRTSTAPRAAAPAMIMDGSGLPLVAFTDSRFTIFVARCHDVSCRQHSLSQVSIPQPSDTSMALRIDPNGYALIAIVLDGDVALLRCVDLFCSEINMVNPNVFAGGPVAAAIDMIIGVDGLPLFAVASPTGNLYTIHCLDLDCAAIDNVQQYTIGPPGSISNPRLTLGPLGRPLIAYQFVPQSDLFASVFVSSFSCATIDCSGHFIDTMVSCLSNSKGASLCSPPQLITAADGNIFLATIGSPEPGGPGTLPPAVRLYGCNWIHQPYDFGQEFHPGCEWDPILPGDAQVLSHNGTDQTIEFDLALTSGPDAGFLLLTTFENGLVAAETLPLQQGVWAFAGVPHGELAPLYPVAPLTVGTELAVMIGSDGLPLVGYIDDDGYLRAHHCANPQCAPNYRQP